MRKLTEREYLLKRLRNAIKEVKREDCSAMQVDFNLRTELDDFCHVLGSRMFSEVVFTVWWNDILKGAANEGSD